MQGGLGTMVGTTVLSPVWSKGIQTEFQLWQRMPNGVHRFRLTGAVIMGLNQPDSARASASAAWPTGHERPRNGLDCLSGKDLKPRSCGAVLMHMLRGTGLAGLKGMSFRSTPNNWHSSIPLVRPLLGTWREEIEYYLNENGIQPAIDASNLDTRYFRNRGEIAVEDVNVLRG